MYGGGGEYSVMSGYGPTNGAVLRILEMFPRLKSPSTNEVWSADEHGEHQPQHDFPKHEVRPRVDNRHTAAALKLSSPVQQPQEVMEMTTTTAPPYADGQATRKTILSDKTVVVGGPQRAEEEEVTWSTIPVYRVRLTTATSAAPPVAGFVAAAAPAPIRLSKDVRDDRKNCQSSVTFSISALLISVISMLFL